MPMRRGMSTVVVEARTVECGPQWSFTVVKSTGPLKMKAALVFEAFDLLAHESSWGGHHDQPARAILPGT
jgi:hypothetical protein